MHTTDVIREVTLCRKLLATGFTDEDSARSLLVLIFLGVRIRRVHLLFLFFIDVERLVACGVEHHMDGECSGIGTSFAAHFTRHRNVNVQLRILLASLVVFFEFFFSRAFREFTEAAILSLDFRELVKLRDVRVETAELCEKFSTVRKFTFEFFHGTCVFVERHFAGVFLKRGFCENS